MRPRVRLAVVLGLLLSLGAGIGIASLDAPVRFTTPCVTQEAGATRVVPCPGEGSTDPRFYVLACWLGITGALVAWSALDPRLGPHRAARAVQNVRMVATLLVPPALVVALVVTGSPAVPAVAVLAPAPLPCPPRDRSTLVQLEPTFATGSPTARGAAASHYGVEEYVFARYFVQRGNDGDRALFELEHRDRAMARVQVIRGRAGWVVDMTEGCASAGPVLLEMMR